VIHPIESDWGLGPVKLFWGSRAYGADRLACEFELTLGHMRDGSAID
jgi:hypothetical protein